MRSDKVRRGLKGYDIQRKDDEMNPSPITLIVNPNQDLAKYMA